MSSPMCVLEDDSLVEVHSNVWPSLLLYFEGPKHLTARVTLKNQIYNKTQVIDYPVQIFTPYGEPNEGILLIWPLACFVFEISTFCPNENPSKLIKAIKDTKRFEWDECFLVCGVTAKIQQPWKDFLIDLNKHYSKFSTEVYQISLEKAALIEIKLDPDVYLKVLDETYAEEVDNFWIYRYQGSCDYFRKMLNMFLGYGIFGCEDHVLRGWIFLSPRGGLHSVFVKKEHRRKGYAKCLINYICKIMLERSTEIFGCVKTSKEWQKNLLMNLGFEYVDTVDWYSTLVL